MIEKDDIQKLATLARIEVSTEEAGVYQKDISNILEYIGQIESVSVDENREVGDVRNVMREDGDVIEPGTYTENILSQAPQREGDSIAVKKIL